MSHGICRGELYNGDKTDTPFLDETCNTPCSLLKGGEGNEWEGKISL